MRGRIFALCVVILTWSIPVRTQSKNDTAALPYPNDEKAVASKRAADLLKHPTFITVRLVSSPRDFSPNSSTDALAHRVGDTLSFRVSVSHSLSETLSWEGGLSHYFEFSPELYKDGDLIDFSEAAKVRVETAKGDPFGFRSIPRTLRPNQPYEWMGLNLSDWYKPLGLGHYQLTLRQRFVWDGDWVESNPIIFEVVSRKPADAIPEGISVEMVPDAFQKQPRQKVYRLKAEDYIAVVVVNDSDSDLSVPVIDLYYGNRPQLFKDGVTLTYLDEIVKLLKSKEKDSRRVELGQNLSVPAHSTAGLQVLDLRKWFGELAPGQYKLTNRRRFEIDGAWTANSAELLFEITR